jgi:hypothetical protein
VASVIANFTDDLIPWVNVELRQGPPLFIIKRSVSLYSFNVHANMPQVSVEEILNAL